MIYTFGNSHAHVFTETHPGTLGRGQSHPNFTSYSLGPTIAFNFYEHHLAKVYNHLENISFNTRHDYIMLVVGEVDCRWHLPYQAALQRRNYQEVVEECVDRFFRCYLDLIKNGYSVIGWAGHPSTTAGHNDDPAEPVFGDTYLRNKITLHWDLCLRSKFFDFNLPYVSIVNELINSEGFTRMEFFSDYCHLDPLKIRDILHNYFAEYNEVSLGS
jgi:hypothetical protein